MNPTITAHCLVKNEERFVEYAIRSVLPYVEKVIAWDNGSTDDTQKILERLQKEFPEKIDYQIRQTSTALEHTALRQEMLDATTTDWWMIVDGDEVWSDDGMKELRETIESASSDILAIICPYYLCVGDIYHTSGRGAYTFFQEDNPVDKIANPRVFRKKQNISWNLGPYGKGDYVKDEFGNIIRRGSVRFLKHKYWHMTALVRSSKDQGIVLGRNKQVITRHLRFYYHTFIIKEEVPRVLLSGNFHEISLYKSLINATCLLLCATTLCKKRYIYE